MSVAARSPESFKLLLCGDVMTGRGIDQILPQPSQPRIHEPYLQDARGYVQLAEEVHGRIAVPVDYAYIWGDALAGPVGAGLDLRLINLETSITTSDRFWPGKGINYRMHPGNLAALQAADLDCCILANNHVLDWGRDGLLETLEVLEGGGIVAVGAGRNRHQARTPAIFTFPGRGRLLIAAYGCESSGVPPDWAAGPELPGLNVLADLSDNSLTLIREDVASVRQPGDLVLVSLHWGGNWGYEISQAEQDFAHCLIDELGVAAVYGHSSHHFKGIEVYRDRLILYSCGDFLNDYEGISGYEDFRSDLVLMYFPTFAASGQLLGLRLAPRRIYRLQSVRTDQAEREWIAATLNREGRQLGTGVRSLADGGLQLEWEAGHGG